MAQQNKKGYFAFTVESDDFNKLGLELESVIFGVLKKHGTKIDFYWFDTKPFKFPEAKKNATTV